MAKSSGQTKATAKKGDAGSAVEAAPEGLDVTSYRRMTPVQALGLFGKLSIASWLWVLGILGAGAASAFGAGYALGHGTAPEWTYSLLGMDNEAGRLRVEEARRVAFAENFADRFLAPESLNPVASGIAEDRPDGLDNGEDLVASLVWQMRAFSGHAYFLSEDIQHELQISFDGESMGLAWPTGDNLVARILADHFPGAGPEVLRDTNAQLNRFGFAEIDGRAIIVREPNGGLTLNIQQ